MKRSVRILCLIIAALMAFGVLYAIFSAVAFAAVPGEKSETAYVTADTAGKPLSVLVSVCVTNPEGLDTLRDTTALTDLENVGGSEAPAKQPDGSWLFEAEGEDVYYQGTADPKDLPLAMSVAYTLDGKPIAGKKLAGQSGRVGITVRFTNRHTQTALVKDENLELFTPFTVVTMITLDEKFSNIAVENAKVMAEAGVNTVTGITFPGLAANIEAEPEDRLAESFTVTADVVDFELENITAIAVTGIVDADDLNDAEDMQEMVDGVDEMSDAGDDLYDGAKELYDGAKDFEEGLGEYLDGIRELYEGSMEASDGVTELLEGVKELADGADELADGADDLAIGVDTLYKSLAGAGSGGGAGGAGQSIPAEAEEITGKLMSACGIDTSNQATVMGLVMEAYAAGAAAAGTAASAQMSQLLSGIRELCDGADQLADGAREMADGIQELADGVDEFREGMIDIEEALRELDENGAELRDGVHELADGLRELRNGVKELNEEGLKELASNTADMQILLDRKDAMVELGQSYDTFAGKPAGMAGSVKFVFETESIFIEKPIDSGAAEELPQGAEPAEEPGFFGRIWNWIRNLFGAA